MFGEAGLAAYTTQMPPPNPPRSPEDAQVSSAERFASLVHSPVSPAFKSARSSTRSSLARQLNGAGDAAKSPAQSKDVENGVETSSTPAAPRQSSRRQAKPARKAAAPVKRELRAKRTVDVKTAIRKSGRPARTQPAKAKPAKAQPTKAQSAKAQPAKRRGRPPAEKAKESKATGTAKGKGQEWEVEKIVDSRIEEETFEHYFRVKWKGFSDKDNTWEPKKNLANCKGLVEAYEKKAGKK